MLKTTISNHRVTQANHLVEANYSITLNEKRLIIIAISKINSKEKMIDRTFTVTAKEFADFYSMDLKNAYVELYEAVDKLWKREAVITDNENELDTIRWIERRKVKKNNRNDGAVTIIFTQSIEPYLSALNRAFTSYEIKNIANLSTPYSIRLYEIGKRYEGLGQYYYELDDFKDLLGLSNNYNRFANLKARVLEPAIKEIKKETDIKMGYKVKRKNKSVIGIRFFVAKTDADLRQMMDDNLSLF